MMMKQKKKNISNPLSSSRGGSSGKSRSQDGIAGNIATVVVGVVILILVATIAISGMKGSSIASGGDGSDGGVMQKKPIRGAGEATDGNIIGDASTKLDDSIILKTAHGNININLRPDLSAESVQYIRDVITAGCDGCELYRAEKPGILQGIFKSNDGAVKPNKIFGSCPAEFVDKKQDCPEHDPHCGCHGPIMIKGMVGWAGGSAGGPDFFINTYEKPAKHWGNQHTVWGFVSDDKSLDAIKAYWELPTVTRGGMHMLRDEVPFTPELPGIMSRFLNAAARLFKR